MLIFIKNHTIFENLHNNLLYSEAPSEFFNYLKKSNLISQFVQLNALIGSIQDPYWHPEGDVWTHTLLVLDAAVEFRKNYPSEKDAISFMLGCLCHDLGKPYTMIYENGRIRNPAHDIKGVFPAKIFLSKLGYDNDVIENVSAMVKEHLRPMQLYKEREKIKNSVIANLQKRVNIKDLINLAKADHNGRINRDEKNVFPHCDWLEKKILEINSHLNETQILSGSDLIDLGIKPGKNFGDLLNKANSLYNQGKFTEKSMAIEWIKQNL